MVAVIAKGFELYETNETDSFVSFSKLYIHFDPWKRIPKEYSFVKFVF